jgi:nucleoside phosphorylase
MNPAWLRERERDDEDYLRRPKRQKTSCSNTENDLIYDRYTVAWIYALHIETAAAVAMLDEIHSEALRRPHDNNAYTLRSIKNHNIVIAYLPKGQFGNNNAASVLTDLKRTFPSICYGLIVGIGGGAPGKLDIRLGDIIVGHRVMQYDFRKITVGGKIKITAVPRFPGYSLRTAVANLKARHELHPNRVSGILQERMENHTNYNYPSTPDRLFQASYQHDQSQIDCHNCDESKLIEREARRSYRPVIHYSRIASSNQVIKDAETYDRLACELDIICFEIEAAGLIDILPCLPI